MNLFAEQILTHKLWKTYGCQMRQVWGWGDVLGVWDGNAMIWLWWSLYNYKCNTVHWVIKKKRNYSCILFRGLKKTIALGPLWGWGQRYTWKFTWGNAKISETRSCYSSFTQTESCSQVFFILAQLTFLPNVKMLWGFPEDSSMFSIIPGSAH